MQNRLFRPKWPTSCASAATSVATWNARECVARPRPASQCVEWQTAEACASLWKGFGLSSYFAWTAATKRLKVASLDPRHAAFGTTWSSATVSSACRPVLLWRSRQSSAQLDGTPFSRSETTSARMPRVPSSSFSPAEALLGLPSRSGSSASMPEICSAAKLVLRKRRRLLLSLLVCSGVFTPKRWLVFTLTSASTLENLLSTRLRRSCAKPSCHSRYPPLSYSVAFWHSRMRMTIRTLRSACSNGVMSSWLFSKGSSSDSYRSSSSAVYSEVASLRRRSLSISASPQRHRCTLPPRPAPISPSTVMNDRPVGRPRAPIRHSYSGSEACRRACRLLSSIISRSSTLCTL
mmetsp:Transcript_33221/g.95554  ORF Transcript_33221/g.95554 Transcript_33221/m.95554 type:complete len:349 (-) Transcript_33221:614-1660(-)